MSTILDALRKAHQGETKPPTPEPVPKKLEIAAPEEATHEVYHFTEEPPVVAPPQPGEPLVDLAVESSPLPPPTASEGSVDEPPSYLPPDEDTGARRRLVARAVAVVIVGVLLGLLVGRRFTSVPPEGDELLTTAALDSGKEVKAEKKGTTKPEPAAPAAKTAKPQPTEARPAPSDAKAAKTPNDGAPSKPARAERAHRGANTESTHGEAKRSRPESEGADIEGPPLPHAASAPPPTPSPPGPAPMPPLAPPQPPPAVALAPQQPAALPPPVPLPFGAPPPAVLPPGAMAAADQPPPAMLQLPSPKPLPPPAVVDLPPPPDDAPDLSLLFIQWSADAAKRVASLRQNSGGSIFIVREGDVIQGLRVATIRPAGVEMQWRGQSFLLPASRY